MSFTPALVLWLVTTATNPTLIATEDQSAVPASPMAGGWSAVDKPATDPEVLAAAQAFAAQLPGSHPRIRRIEHAERQVVAGTNYRLVIRLTNRSRWSATVWHTLDGRHEVSEIKRLR